VERAAAGRRRYAPACILKWAMKRYRDVYTGEPPSLHLFLYFDLWKMWKLWGTISRGKISERDSWLARIWDIWSLKSPNWGQKGDRFSLPSEHGGDQENKQSKCCSGHD
jgi:hypothetical protein